MMHMDMGMKMFFHTDLSDSNILIYGWDAKDGVRLTGTLIAVLLIAVMYEYLKLVRVWHRQSVLRAMAADLNEVADVAKPWYKQVRSLVSFFFSYT